MGWNDHLFDNNWVEYVDTCPKCEKRFRCEEIDQVIGAKDKDYKVCPYCHTVICSSMTVEYICRELNNKE